MRRFAARWLPVLALLLAPAPAWGDGVVRLFNWNNYITDQSVEEFEARCRCRLEQDYFADNEEMLAKLAAGAVGYDVMVPTANTVETLIRSGQLLPLDKKRLPHLVNVKPEFLDLDFDPGNVYSVPYAYSVTLLGYNEEKLRELALPTDTWQVLFEPRYLEKLKGRVTVLDSQRELFGAALIYLGYSVNETDEARLKQARDLILRAKPYWAAFNATSYAKELAVGNIWLAHGYSNDMQLARQDARRAGRRFHIGFTTPKEGAIFALDNLVIHKSARHVELAHRFIDFWLEGRAPAAITNAIGAGNVNRAAMQWVDPEIASNPDLFPDAQTFKRLQQVRDYDRRTRRLLNRLWVEVKVR